MSVNLDVSQAENVEVIETAVHAWTKEVCFDLGGLSVLGVLSYGNFGYEFATESVQDALDGIEPEIEAEVREFLDGLDDADLYHLDRLTRKEVQ
jgi:hypothetical protein